MRRSMIITTLAASMSMAGWCGSASAQSVEFYVGPSAAYDSYYDDAPYRGYYYAPPAYRYYRRGGGYFERPEHYRYGSSRWWRQMDRTGRGGHRE